MRLTPWLSLFSTSPTRRDLKSIKAKRRSIVDRLESLEDRVMLAGTTLYVDSTPTINGGSNDDVFTPSGGSLTTQVGLELGTNLFTTINAALAVAIDGDEIQVANGSYNELVTVSNGVTLKGNQFGNDARIARGAESIIDGSTFGGVVSVNGTNKVVVIDGFKMTADATISTNVNGFGAAITTVHSGGLTSLNIKNNVIEHASIGISPRGTGITIQQNVIRDLDIPGGAAGTGIYTDFGLTGALIDANTFSNVQNTAIDINTAGGSNVISNNVMDSQIYLHAQTGSQVTGNVITNSFSGGIVLGGNQSGIIVTNNEVNGVADGYSAFRLRNDLGGPNSTVTATNNKFIGGTLGYGVRPGDGSYTGTLTLTDNQISGGPAAIQNDDAALAINAAYNYFGTTTASTVNTAIQGIGAANVDFTPFLNLGDTASGTVGFQASHASLTVHTFGNQIGGGNRVQEGISNVTSGGTVNIAAGTYSGALTVDRNVSLIGNSPANTIIDGGGSPGITYNTGSVTEFLQNLKIIGNVNALANPAAATITKTNVIEINSGATETTVQGTGSNDSIQIRNNGGVIEVQVNGGGWASVPGDKQLVITGGVGDDNLVLDFTGGSPIPTGGMSFDGGAGGNDKLTIIGNTLLNATLHHTNANDGTINLDGRLLTYAGLDPISVNTPGANWVLEYTSDPAAVTLADDGGGNLLVTRNGVAEQVTISPAGLTSLTIKTGAGADTVEFDSLPVGWSAGITIDGEGLADVINFDTSDIVTTGSLTLQNIETANLSKNITATSLTGTATTIGVAPTAQIQDAISIALSSAATVINVAAGTYTENLTLGKQLSLKGAKFGVDARGRVGGVPNPAVESIITAVSGDLLSLFSGVAGATVIDGFTFSGGTRGIESFSGPLDGLQISNNDLRGSTNSEVFLNDNGVNITVNQNSINGSSQTGGDLFHLDTDGFNGFYLTNNWLKNRTTGTGFLVDGNHNVGPSGLRTPLISGNLIDNNQTGMNLGKFAFGSLGTPNAGTVSLNTFSNNLGDGLQGGMQHVAITQNTFTGNTGSGLALTGFSGSLSADNTRGAQNNQVTQNTFSGNTRDLNFNAFQFPGTIATNAVYNNSLGSATGALYNGTETIQISGNWWGTSTNPETVVGKISGTGAAFIDYSPWLNSGTDTDGITAGFQGDYSNIYVDDDSAFSTLAYGAITPVSGKYITEGYDSLTSPGTLHVLTGSYVENVDMTAGADKAVTLSAGASPGQVSITGNLVLSANDTLPIELTGSSASLYDSFTVSGNVTLGNATLSPTLSFAPTGGTIFTIVDKTSPGAISGIFNGILDNHVYVLGGFQFQATYQGGLGDDNNFTLSYIDPANPILNGTPGSDALKVQLDAGGTNVETYIGATLIDSRPLASLTTFVVNGLGGGDTLTVDYTNGNPIPAGGLTYNGGAGASDKLIVTGTPSFATLTYDVLSAGAGKLTINGATTINFTGLEPVVVVPVVGVVTIDIDPTAIVAGTVTSTFTDAGAGTNLVSFSGGLESMTFANPTVELVVNGDAVDNDDIVFTSLNAGFNAEVTVNGSGGTDSITLNTALTLGSATSSGDVTLTAETINLGANIHTDAGPASGNVSLTATTTNITGPVTIDTNGATDGTLSVTGAVIGAGQTLTLDIGPANNVLLNNVGNDLGTVAVTTGNNVTLNDINAIDLGASTISGNLIVTSGAITDSGALLITGTTSLTAGANPITLTDLNNFGGSVTIVSGSVVALNDINDIDIAAATVSNTLAVTATGNITDSGAISVTNNASFSGATITLGDAGESTNFGSLTFNSAGAVVITEDTSTLIAGVNTALSLDLTSAAGISDAGATSTLVGANTHVTGTSIDLGVGAATFNTTSLTFNSAGTVTIAEDSGLDLSGASTAGPLNLTVTGNITESGTVTAGATSLTAGAITMNGANVLGDLTVNNGTGAVSITEADPIVVAGITHTSGTLTLSSGANPITVNGPIVINTAGNVNFLTTGTLNLNNNVTAAGVIMGTPVIVNVNNNTAQIQDGVDAALAGATVNVNAAVTFSENVSVPKNLTLLATLDNVTISGGAGGAALTVTAGTVSATGFYMNTAAASSTVNVTGGSLTLRDNVIVESSGFAQAAITVGGAGALNMGVNATSTPGNNSITLSGAGTLLSNAVAVDASGNYWGSNVFATITAGISSPGTVDYSPYLNVGTNLAGIGFQGDYSDLTAHAAGSQAGVAAITEAYNMLTAVGTIHALTGSYTETVNLGAGADKAVTFHAGASPGQVVITGNLTLTANDTLPIELTAYVAPDAAGPTAESTVSDNFTVSGTVTLGNATLLPIVSYAAQPFERFTIINNLSAGAVVGTFAGAAEGFIYNVGGVRLRVSYVEFHNTGSLPSTPSFFGDGNDVSLTVMTPPVLVELTTSGTLNITGTGWVDDFDLEISGTNQVTLRGNDVTNFQFGTTNTQILGPITVTGNINMSLGNSNDRVLLRGVGAGAKFDSGNLNIDLGSGNDSVSTTDITAPITLTTGLTLTGDLSILGGTGDDVISLGGLALADTFVANAISIDTGTGGIQTVSLDRTTVGTDVTIKNGGTTGLQTVALGVNGPDSIGRNLIITQADGATGYTVGIHETDVGGFVNVTNGSGSGAAVVTIDTTTATTRTIGGSTTITNGNNVTNAVNLVGTVGALKLTGNVTVKNGIGSTSNDITVTDVIDSGTTASTFTNGTGPDNAILFNGALRNTFLGTVAATNGASTGTNAITATRLSSTKGINLINGNATTSNTLTLGGVVATTDRVVVTGNLVLTNGNATAVGGTNTVSIGGLTTMGPAGNVTLRNGTSGTGGTGVTMGAAGANPGANLLSGNLSIANLASTGTRAVTLDRLTVHGRTGVAVNESVAGVSTLSIGTVSAVVIDGKLDVQDGSSSSTMTLATVDVGSITYNDLGGGTDTINLADAAGLLRVFGVTRLNLGAGSDIVNIGAATLAPPSTGVAIFNDSVFISLGAGNDILNIGPAAASPAFSSARKFQIDGGAGVDTIKVDPISMADYTVGSVPKKLKAKLTNFENIT